MENSFRNLAKEAEEREQDPSKEVQEGGKEGQNPEDKGNKTTEEEGTQNNSPQKQDDNQNIEEGEISIGSESDEANEVWATPKKKGRGRKSKNAERNQEAYKDVLNGSQPTIQKMMTAHNTWKQAKASQGGHPPPKVYNDHNLLEL